MLASSALLFAFILQAKQSELDSQLFHAARAGKIGVVSDCLVRGANPNAHEVLTTVTNLHAHRKGGTHYPGDTPLIVSIRGIYDPEAKDTGLMKLLISNGADVNAKGNAGYTPLIAAVQLGNLTAAKLLLASGAKPNLRNINGTSALEMASNADNVDCVKVLLDAGADTKSDGESWTALMEAAYGGNVGIVKILLAHSADPNDHPKGLMSPLECARIQGFAELAGIIEKAGGKGRSVAKLNNLYRSPVPDEPKTIPTTFLKATSTDYQLLNLAVASILDTKSEPREFFSPRSKLFVQDTSFGRFDADDENQMNYDIGDDFANEIGLDMRSSLVVRNSGPAKFSANRFQEKPVKVVNEKFMEDEVYPKARRLKDAGYVVVRLMPGYSKDGKSAVLKVRVGPSAHGAATTFFFVKSTGGWQIKWKKATRYA